MRVNADLAAAAECARERSGDHGLLRILERQVQLLEALDHDGEVVPFAFLGRQKNQGEVRSGAEVLALIGDHHGFEILFRFVEPRAHHAHVIFAEGVHLTVKFDAQDAVAEVDQRCARVRI